MLMKIGLTDESESVQKAIYAKESNGSYMFCKNPELIPDSQVELVLKKLRGMRSTAEKHLTSGRKNWEKTYGLKRIGG